MSANAISEDLKRLPSIVEEEFGRALIEDIAPSLAANWKGQVIEVDAVDSRTYLDSIAPGDPVYEGGGVMVVVEAPAAEGYSDVVERGWKDRARRQESYPGRYPAKRGVEASEDDIKAALDRAGDRVKG